MQTKPLTPGQVIDERRGCVYEAGIIFDVGQGEKANITVAYFVQTSSVPLFSPCMLKSDTMERYD